MIVIIDYGLGNLRSIQKALQSLGFSSEITKEKRSILSSSGIILPGVGAFDAGMEEIRALNLENVILEQAAMNKPLLGICLGLQLLMGASEEGKQKGLGLIQGSCKRFPPSSLAVPQMGWNRLIVKRTSPILAGIKSGAMMYFAHSYFADPADEGVVAAETDYGTCFASVISRGNIFGVQFHPEKSGDAGLELLRNFGVMCKT